MNLIRAELERLGARRFVQLMIVLLMLAFGVTAATTLAGSHQPSAVELAEAQRQAAANLRGMELEHERCLARDRGEPLPGDEGFYLPPDCSELDPALRDRLPVAADYLTGVFTFTRQAEPLLYFLVAYLVLFGFLVGASYIGADLNSGGVVNLLLWRPRRLTVLGAKLGTLLGAVLTVSVLASLAYLVTFWVIAQVAGYPGPTNAAFWADLGAIWGRGLTLVLLAAATGFASRRWDGTRRRRSARSPPTWWCGSWVGGSCCRSSRWPGPTSSCSPATSARGWPARSDSGTAPPAGPSSTATATAATP